MTLTRSRRETVVFNLLHWLHRLSACCDRGLRPNRSWLLSNLPGKGVFARPRPKADLKRRPDQPRISEAAGKLLHGDASRNIQV